MNTFNYKLIITINIDTINYNNNQYDCLSFKVTGDSIYSVRSKVASLFYKLSDSNLFMSDMLSGIGAHFENPISDDSLGEEEFSVDDRFTLSFKEILEPMWDEVL